MLMGIKVIIGATTFECGTPEEAARIHQLLAGGIPHAAAQQRAPNGVVSSLRPVSGSGRARVRAAHDFLNRLKPYVGQRLNAGDMMKVAGVEHINGLGPKLALYRRALETERQSLDDFILKMKGEPGELPTWEVRQVNGS